MMTPKTPKTNIMKAHYYARLINCDLTGRSVSEIMGRRPDGFFGEDSDYMTAFWRIGGNAMLCYMGGEYRADRWDLFVKQMRHFQILSN